MKLTLTPTTDIRHFAVTDHGRFRLGADRLFALSDQEAVALAKERYGDGYFRLIRVVKETREVLA